MKNSGSAKIILIGIGAMLAYNHFGAMGLVMLGVLIFLMG